MVSNGIKWYINVQKIYKEEENSAAGASKNPNVQKNMVFLRIFHIFFKKNIKSSPKYIKISLCSDNGLSENAFPT